MGVQERLGAVPPPPPGQVYQSQLARGLLGEGRISGWGPGDLECTCPGFAYRGNCKHVREVREKVFEG